MTASPVAAGEPVLLLPGMMCDERLFAPQVPVLQAAGHPVSVGDLTTADSIAGLARDVLSKAPDRFALAGLSMGGIVALEMVRQAPERISRLALLDTNSREEDEERQRIRDRQMESVRQGGLKEIMRHEMKPRYLAQESLERKGLLNGVLEMAMDLGQEVFLRQSVALRNRPDSLESLAHMNLPALVLCGEGDSLCPVSYHELMAANLPLAILVVVPSCGHLSTLEQPAAVNNALLKWLGAAKVENPDVRYDD